MEKIVEVFDAGKRARLDADQVIEEDHPIAAAPPATPERVKEMRRQKMRLISDTSVSSRARPFDAFPHMPMMDQHKYIDLMFMVFSGELQDSDTTIQRHLKSGEYETITIAQWKDQMRRSYWLRQKLNQHDQSYTDQVNAIRDNPKMTDEEKLVAIGAVTVPEYLDVDKASTDRELVMRHGKWEFRGRTLL